MPSQLFTSSATFTTAAGVTSVRIDAWGGGGAGGQSGTAEGGGGGGGYSLNLAVVVTELTGYAVTIGAGGVVGVSDGNGGSTIFPGNAVTVTAAGGLGAAASVGGAGGGGTYAGGAGGSTTSHTGGGGGGSSGGIDRVGYTGDPPNQGAGGQGGAKVELTAQQAHDLGIGFGGNGGNYPAGAGVEGQADIDPTININTGGGGGGGAIGGNAKNGRPGRLLVTWEAVMAVTADQVYSHFPVGPIPLAPWNRFPRRPAYNPPPDPPIPTPSYPGRPFIRGPIPIAPWNRFPTPRPSPPGVSPIPPVPTRGTGFPLVPRVPEIDSPAGRERLRLNTDLTSAIFNSLFRQGHIIQTASQDYAIVGHTDVTHIIETINNIITNTEILTVRNAVFNADRNPNAFDDVDDNVVIGGTWVNTTDDTVWFNVDNTRNAAIWVKLTTTVVPPEPPPVEANVPGCVIDARDYGVVPGVDCTAAFDNLVKTCPKNATIVLPCGTLLVTGTVDAYTGIKTSTHVDKLWIQGTNSAGSGGTVIAGSVDGPLLAYNHTGYDQSVSIRVSGIGFNNSHPNGTGLHIERVEDGWIQCCQFRGNKGLVIGAVQLTNVDIGIMGCDFNGSLTNFPGGVGLAILGQARLIQNRWSQWGTGARICGKVDMYGARFENCLSGIEVGLKPTGAGRSTSSELHGIQLEACTRFIRLTKDVTSCVLSGVNIHGTGNVVMPEDPEYGIKCDVGSNRVTMINASMSGAFAVAGFQLDGDGPVVCINCTSAVKGGVGVEWSITMDPALFTAIQCNNP